MRRILTLSGIATAVVMTAVAVFIVSTLPPKALRPPAAGERATVALGAYHVHSSRSDGSGTVEEIAAAAAGAELDFVILTDHGDATRLLDAPRRVNGVLIIDAVEINTDAGHFVALGLQQPSSYPLAGDARDVLDDIHRLGGWAVAAHPDSPRPNLRWRGQTPAVDGVEWVNVDSEWRGHSATTVASTALRAMVRAPESIGTLIRVPAPGLARWDAMLRTRPVVALAAVDAHARLGTDEARWGGGASLRLPSYSSLFRTIAQAVPLAGPLTGDAARDATAILQSLRTGQSYSLVRAIADVRPAIQFTAATQTGRIGIGGHVIPALGGRLSVETPALPAARIDLLRDGRVIAHGQGGLEFEAPPASGAYRVEAFVPGQAVPWIVTNPIYFDRAEELPEPAGNATAQKEATGIAVPHAAWKIEAETSSRASVEIASDGVLQWSYQLGGGAPAGQYTALATDAGGSAALDRIEVTASANTPMRLSLQVRVPGGRDGRRWRKSLFLDREPRTYVVRLSELEPVERGSALRPIVARVQAVLLVIDTVNTLPGHSGVVRISQVRLVPGATPPVPPGQR